MKHRVNESNANDAKSRTSAISRRGFLKTATAGAMGAAIGAPPLFSAPSAEAQGTWLREADIVVVGSGAAGSSAALNAQRLGSSVVMVEKATGYGGTTAKSGGEYWIPNNSLMRAQGIQDTRQDALRYMVRVAYPHLYNPEDPHLGLLADQYEVLGAFYDNADSALDALHSMTTIRSRTVLTRGGQPRADYRSDLPENKVIRGRGLGPKTASGQDGRGADLTRQMREAVVQKNIPILFNHRVTRLLVNGHREVFGVEVKTPEGETAGIRARKAVIFCSGGFSQNRELRLSFLRGPIFGGCAVPTNEGDFVQIASGLGASLVNMNSAWWAEIVLEQAVNSSVTPFDAFAVPGESMVVVNRYGRRVVNEKVNYNDRTQVHFIWDPGRHEYTNLLTFMIYDQRTADQSAGSFPLPQRGRSFPYILSGQTIEELQHAIETRLDKLRAHTGNFTLDAGFGKQLQKTIARFNEFAKRGQDDDFHRGETLYDLADYADPGKRNPTMFPIASEGPYYAVMLVAGTLDTHGGPKINAQAQVVDTSGKPIVGLYGAGNCIGFGGQAYWGRGSTIGPALTFGYIAAREATKEAIKKADQSCAELALKT